MEIIDLLVSLIPIIVMLVPLGALWFDIRKLQTDLPQKTLEQVSKSFEMLEKDNAYRSRREKHLLNYIEYLWQWIETYKPKRVRYPKFLEDYLQEKYMKSPDNSV